MIERIPIADITIGERRRKKAHIPEAVRWAVWERDDFRCHYCGSRSFLTIDHVQPESEGGSPSISNLVTACRKCNTRKARRDYGGFRLDEFSESAHRRATWDRDDYSEHVRQVRRWMASLEIEMHFLLDECQLRYGD